MEKLYSNLHRKYDLSKTLKFELKPMGETKENIEKNGILKQDEYRATIFKKVKKYCDEYHKIFIEECMENFELSKDVLEEYYSIARKLEKTNEDKKRLEQLKENLRKEISNRFKKSHIFKGLFDKEMINIYLTEMYKNNKEEFEEISEFKKFTTYFNGFNQNRANMYVATADSTAIAHRLVDENLPVFINNMKSYKIIKDKLNDKIVLVFKELNPYIQVDALDEMFCLEYFNATLSQKGIEIYNIILSGKSEENGNKIKGLNEYINEYNQTHKDSRLPKLTQLYKQILSDKIGASFVIDNIKNDNELVKCIYTYYQIFKEKMPQIIDIINNIENYDLDRIYLNNDLTLTQISTDIFDNWSKINELIKDEYDKHYTGKYKKDDSKYEDERKKNTPKIYSIQFLEDLINNTTYSLVSYIKNYVADKKICENISGYYKDCEEILNHEYGDDTRSLLKDEKTIEKIKNLLDEMKSFQAFVKLLMPKDSSVLKDEVFYGSLTDLYNEISLIISVYNKVRNYLTQKPYSTEKIKINFETPTLLVGWDANKEKDNLGVILAKNGEYFLGIINPHNRKIFVNTECDEMEVNYYQKMEYKLLPGPNKMLPKVFFSQSRIDEFKPSQELLEKYNKGFHKKGENFDLNFCHKLIDFFKISINKHEDWKNFNFQFKDTSEYNDISEFYKEVEKQGYKISFKNYSEEYIHSLVKTGDLYLFQIYNKDFSKYSKGKPNLHTMYWKALFSEENLEDVVFKLNGEAEVFYRKASLKLDDTVIHAKNVPIKNKNEENPKKESKFNYDIIKNKRYTEDKFQFHVPITINFKNEGKNYLNEEVNKYLKNNDVNVIGIDRGERNLIYISVINANGEILYQKSLNKIYNDQAYSVDYHNLLDEKEKEREKARESWKTIENIKELKEGYLSQVIHEIVLLMEKYNAIIVMEDLNKGFKNARIRVEKQVYQKFEKMLIDKLNYLIFKDKEDLEEGGLLNGYQLTNKFESFKKIGRQTGILFYIPAWCTSKIDPITGFVNLLNTQYESIEKSKEFINAFDDVRYNAREGYFEFEINYKNKKLRRQNSAYGSREKWTLCSYGDRIETFRNPKINNNWDTREINLTQEFKDIFNEYNVNFDNMKADILKQNEKSFWERLMKLIKLTVQMRNSIPNSEIDYLISPIKNHNGYFYDSRNHIDTLPIDADANGAYNIARKGLMLIEQIRSTDEEKLGKIDYRVSNQDWLSYVQRNDK